jgi:hypothetical protein
VVDGMLRLKAILAIRAANDTAFAAIPAYVVDHDRRYEIRYQTDIYQDLLPSQLATLVEHLHQSEGILKVDIARYIGVSPPTLRNYTGLARMIGRGGLFAGIVELMDVGVIPSSNPYAWLRLTDDGLRYVLENNFSEYAPAEDWITGRIARARRGDAAPYSIKYVEAATSSLSGDCYLANAEVRSVKRELGLRRAAALKSKKEAATTVDATDAITHLSSVAKRSPEPVVQAAARHLARYLA